jgi:hypothetical protein
VRTARATAPATRFLGVRLTAEEESLLDRFRQDHGLSSRSDAVRLLLKESGSSRAPEAGVPVTIREELEELVEDGYARDVDGALALVVTLGIGELSRTHTERRRALRDHARASRERSESRRRADREGRGLLGR